mmetsp:Transcript_44144/g.172130  ORF Transcript_44144/g.172130 Transcript_44144/m.172130 type:complete len:83 (+) Transcript_44144:101-349(+)
MSHLGQSQKKCGTVPDALRCDELSQVKTSCQRRSCWGRSLRRTGERVAEVREVTPRGLDQPDRGVESNEGVFRRAPPTRAPG